MMQCHLLPVATFQAALAQLAEQTGFAVDSRLFAIAVGVSLHAREIRTAAVPRKGLPALPARPRKAAEPSQPSTTVVPAPLSAQSWSQWMLSRAAASGALIMLSATSGIVFGYVLARASVQSR
jgi:hypothetical protein